MFQDVRAIAKSTDDAAVRRVAELATSEYNYPVDSQVFSADGELIDHVGANDIMRNDMDLIYRDFLDRSDD